MNNVTTVGVSSPSLSMSSVFRSGPGTGEQYCHPISSGRLCRRPACLRGAGYADGDSGQAGCRTPAAGKGEVPFEHVGFSYVPDVPVLKDIKPECVPGQTVALVGQTGSGKTTVTALISRLYDVTSGSVKIDGHDVRDVQRTSIARQMGVVLQDPFLFSGTVRDNLRYGRPGATDEEIIRGTKAVGAHEFILQFENGYDTVLDERGQNLSLGQRQLLSFARAIIADPRILVLDDATAKVDSTTEAVIQQALKQLMKGRTSFVIAHRLSTIRSADRIVVLRDGSIVEEGTHDELVRREGVYSGLYRMTYESEQAGGNGEHPVTD